MSLIHIMYNEPVEFSAYYGFSSHKKDSAKYVMLPEDLNVFLNSLEDTGELILIIKTLQSLWQRENGTLLLTAFPSINDFIDITTKLNNVPIELMNMIKQWKEDGACEVNIDFVQNMSLI
ncbi:hypothetical protein [Photobacterium phosphoreum]|uniref:hypothetical protein n=1 Tax=Photobacterium phosphoreum TaxID=659 RepID=UPI0024B75D5C|nr:hypothetical protein [Photobacterium phosphoreum]